MVNQRLKDGRSPLCGSGSQASPGAPDGSPPTVSIPNAGASPAGAALDREPRRFWTISQNNSGGIFDHDREKGVGYAICVEARTPAEAEARLRAIIDSYPASYDCPCCGDRWSIWLDDEGASAPEMYGAPLTGGWGYPAYVHYLDGHFEAVGSDDASGIVAATAGETEGLDEQSEQSPVGASRDAHHLPRSKPMTSSPNTLEDGWIEWKGGKCPVAPDTLVQVQYRNEARIIAERFTPKRAGIKKWKWTTRGHDVPSGADIIAYRVVQS